MGSCMVEKFKQYIDLRDDEKALLQTMQETKEQYRAGEQIAKMNDPIEDIFVVSEGWVIISSNLDKNLRSVYDVKFSGDIIGISELSFSMHMFDIYAITDVEVCPFPRKNLFKIFKESPRLCKTFYNILSREQALLYERIVSIGRRTAIEKVAHFVIETYYRQNFIGMNNDNEINWRMRQENISDLLGLSSIHVSKAMSELRKNEYIDYNRSSLKILDFDRLVSLSNFSPKFLEPPYIKYHEEA